MDDIYFIEIEKIEKIYVHFCKITPLGFPKPKNLEEEKIKFFENVKNNKIYNPQIKYELNHNEIINYRKLKNEINNINIDNDKYGIKELYKKKLKTRFLQVRYNETWGTELSSRYAIKYWKKPSRSLLLKAEIYCEKYKKEISNLKYFDCEICGEELKKEVKMLTGDEIKINYVNLASKVNIEPNKQLIEINKNEKFTSLDIKRLKVHEIGVHYMRYYNARKFKIKLFEVGSEGYLETEEGLAAYNEWHKGVLSENQLFIYAGRVIATYYCISKSFYEIYEILKSYKFTDNEAFSICFRVKRNLCDTSLNGGFTKDYVYFKGFYSVMNFAKKNDINKLFIGKISIKNVKILDKYIEKKYEEIESPFKKKN